MQKSQKLIESDKVDFVVGYIWSNVLLASLKPLLSGAGLALAARGLTNMDPRSMLGIGLGQNAIHVEKAITIDAPIDEVYRYWQNFENIPAFMSHVK